MTRRAKLGSGALAVVAALLVADVAAWFAATSRMAAELARWRQTQEAAGCTVEYGAPVRSGWPVAAELALPEVVLATGTPGEPGTLSWRSERVVLSLGLTHPTRMDVRADGPQWLQAGAAPPVLVQAAALRAAVPLGASGQASTDVTGIGLDLPGGVAVERLGLRLRATDAFVSVAGVRLPVANLPFGGTVQSLDGHARVTGPLPDLRDPAAALRAWRDSGERLLLDGVALRWGPLDLQGNATLGIGRTLQPEGSASVRVTGWSEVLEALARSGAITRNDARVVGTLLGLMARPGEAGHAEADLPLTLRDGTLSVGAIPVLRLPALAPP